jgi:ferredoxin
MPDGPMQVSVDADLCGGHAACWSVCPEVFVLTDDGYAEVIVDVVPVELEATVQGAADHCPTHAITIS